jgi:actin-related protein
MLVGLNQLDLIRTISQLLSAFPDSIARELRKNIHIVGGGSQIAGLSERLTRDLIRESPVGSVIGVTIGKGGYAGAYKGMQYIGKY